MATTFIATDLNEKQWAKREAERFGMLVMANRWLMLLTGGLLTALVLVGIEVHRNTQALANFKPLVVRIDKVGSAEAVHYNDFAYHPQAPEVRRDLALFVTNFFTHKRDRLNEYYESKYDLSQELGIRSYSEDQKTHWVKDVLASRGPEYSAVVRNVTILNLTTAPYLATVAFQRIFYGPDGMTETRREDATATIRFTFADNVSDAAIPYNPLGLTITDFHMDVAFH